MIMYVPKNYRLYIAIKSLGWMYFANFPWYSYFSHRKCCLSLEAAAFRLAVVSKYFGCDLVFILALTKVSSERSSIWSTFVMFDELLVLLFWNRSIAICANNATIMWVDPFGHHRSVTVLKFQNFQLILAQNALQS